MFLRYCILLFTWFSLAIPLCAGEVLIRDVTVVSPHRQGTLEHAYVVIRDTKIHAVTLGMPTVRDGVEVIDGSSLYLVPGLVDSHVHLGSVPGMTFKQKQQHPKLVAAYQTQLPRSYLYFGFTTLIDLNVVSRNAIDAMKSAPASPDIYDCDCALVLANGYPMNYVPEQFRFDTYRNFLYDPTQKDAIPTRFNAADHTPAAAVQRVVDAGGICIKTHYEPGFGGIHNLPLPSEQLMGEVLAEGRRRGLPVTMHANSLQAYRFAAMLGVDIIGHGLWNWQVDNPAQDKLPAEVVAVLNTVLAKKVGVMPTSQVIAGLRAHFEPSYLKDPLLRDVLPGEMVDWFQTDAGQWFTDSLRASSKANNDETLYKRYDGILNHGTRATRYLVEHSGKLVFGSDTPAGRSYANPPGYNGYLEIQRLASTGLDLQKLLSVLTLDTARTFNLDQEIGSVETGKRANLLLLGSNPLQSAQAYGDIQTVIIGGKVLQRSKLSARDGIKD